MARLENCLSLPLGMMHTSQRSLWCDAWRHDSLMTRLNYDTSTELTVVAFGHDAHVSKIAVRWHIASWLLDELTHWWHVRMGHDSLMARLVDETLRHDALTTRLSHDVLGTNLNDDTYSAPTISCPHWLIASWLVDESLHHDSLPTRLSHDLLRTDLNDDTYSAPKIHCRIDWLRHDLLMTWPFASWRIDDMTQSRHIEGTYTLMEPTNRCQNILIVCRHDSLMACLSHDTFRKPTHRSEAILFNYSPRPTQSIMYVPLQVNRFKKIILLIVQYKYLKSCSRRFIVRIWSSAQDYAVRYLLLNPVVFLISAWQNLSGGNDLYWRCTSFEKAFRRGRALNILHDS